MKSIVNESLNYIKLVKMILLMPLIGNHYRFMTQTNGILLKGIKKYQIFLNN